MVHLVVAYDVIDDRRRNRLAKFMMGYLDRVQKSVFEGKIEEKRFEPMKTGIEEIIDREEDTVRIYELCARCISAVRVIGTGKFIEEPEDDLII
jgi:CRISPR-associated protein Cas2